jgi:hypothetical protein
MFHQGHARTEIIREMTSGHDFQNREGFYRYEIVYTAINEKPEWPDI